MGSDHCPIAIHFNLPSGGTPTVSLANKPLRNIGDVAEEEIKDKLALDDADAEADSGEEESKDVEASS